MPSEKAAVMEAHYSKVYYQGRRNDIIRELQILSGQEPDENCCHNGNRLKSIDKLAAEYGFSPRNAARYLRINSLTKEFKDMPDAGLIPFLSAVEVSYLTEKEQKLLYGIMDRLLLKLKPAMAERLHEESGNLSEEKLLQILDGFEVKKACTGVNVKISKAVCSKYFDGMNTDQMASVVEQALEAWFSGR